MSIDSSEYSSPFIILRSPLFPYEVLLNAYSKKPNDNSFQTELIAFFEKNELAKKALYVGSPSLYREFTAFIEVSGKVDRKKERKLTDSLLKYLIRMTTRCTPFGLFAGSTIANVENNNIDHSSRIEVTLGEEIKLHKSISMDFWMKLYLKVTSIPEVQNALSYSTNTTLNKKNNVWKYTKIDLLKSSDFTESFNIPNNSILEEIIARSEKGITLQEVSDIIVNHGFEESDAQGYIQELISSQVLIDELFPNVTGEKYTDILLQESIRFTTNLLPDLQSELVKLKKWLNSNNSPQEFSIAESDKLMADLSRILDDSESGHYNPPRVQTDAYYDVKSSSLANFPKDELKECLELLSMLSQDTEKDLENFKEIFHARYAENEVPLSLVLDPEIGIDYTCENFARLSNNAESLERIKWNAVTKFKFNLYQTALKNNSRIISLDKSEIEDLGIDSELPDSFSILGNMFQTDEQFSFQLSGVIGPSFANLSTRFCHGNHNFKQEVLELMQKENDHYSHSIPAEISHFPNAHSIPLISRPKLRSYEIPYLTRSTVPIENQLKIDDLYLTIVQNELLLLSKKHGKRIIPKLTNAHSYFQLSNPPIYRFLGDLQQQNRKYIRWDWEFLKGQPYLPRVCYKNIILCPAVWSIKSKLLLKIEKTPKSSWNEQFQVIRKDLEIPRFVELSDADNNLLLDLESEQGVRILILETRKTGADFAKLKEVLYSEKNLLVHNERGSFTNEVIIPFVKEKVEEKIPRSINSAIGEDVSKRKFSPCEDWVYIKIYAEAGVLDKLLTEKLNPINEALQKDGIISNWFFIRYADPDYHIRIRYKLIDKNEFSKIVNDINDALKDYVRDLLVWNVTIDTYDRELERYGDSSIDITEYLFSLNSQLVLNLQTRLFSNGEYDVYKLSTALCISQVILSAFTEDITEQRKYVLLVRDSFAKEFNAEGGLSKLVTPRFRTERAFLEQLYDFKELTNPVLKAVKTMAESLRPVYQKHIESIIEIDFPNGELTEMYTLISGHIHMFVNRFYSNDQRFFEFIIYGVWEIWLTSIEKRQKSK